VFYKRGCQEKILLPFWLKVKILTASPRSFHASGFVGKCLVGGLHTIKLILARFSICHGRLLSSKDIKSEYRSCCLTKFYLRLWKPIASFGNAGGPKVTLGLAGFKVLMG
jgi:hypothetical protein